MLRALCVLASYEQMQTADEASYLLGYVPAKGLEVVHVEYDPYNDADTDGDGNVFTETTTTLVPRNEVVLPELEDLARAMQRCTGPGPKGSGAGRRSTTTCSSDDRDFKLGLKPGPAGELLLTRIEVIERPPCGAPTK